MPKMQTIQCYFGDLMIEGIRASVWFRTAPPKFQAKAKIKMLGIEQCQFSSMVHTTTRPALIAECEVGGEVQRFSLLLDNTSSVQPINCQEKSSS